jgi:GNAT superfamily N-acetyltransferase
MHLTFEPATASDATALAALYTAVAEDLTRRYGCGPWSSKRTEKGVQFAMRTSRVFLVREDAEIVGTFRLATKKPWAIDTTCFTAGQKPLYLQDMAVVPARQRKGIGRRCLERACDTAQAWPADAIRLDAFDAAAGAGAFYARCGFAEVGRVTYRKTPLIYYEVLLGQSHK